MLREKANDMFAGAGFDTTRGLDKIDTTGVNLKTMTMEKPSVMVGEDIPVGLTHASLDEFMASRKEIATLTKERLPTGIRGWFRRMFIR